MHTDADASSRKRSTLEEESWDGLRGRSHSSPVAGAESGAQRLNGSRKKVQRLLSRKSTSLVVKRRHNRPGSVPAIQAEMLTSFIATSGRRRRSSPPLRQ